MRPVTSKSQEALRNIYNDALGVPMLPTPAEDTHRVGKLTAEAMKIEYDSAAKAIEAMGDHLLELQKRMDNEARNILDAIDEVNRIAAHYRQEGKEMFDRIEDCARQTQRVREICTDLAPKPAER